ncbi:hypothetical protein PybrP1_000178 [[Pythium] brassicae (nom. inval.)]|nr:hypothetical protein PybrP1_000178 [[Pythium] brassicae (nom. inval.)]
MARWKLVRAAIAALALAACAAAEPRERSSESSDAPAPSTSEETSPVVTVELQAADGGAEWADDGAAWTLSDAPLAPSALEARKKVRNGAHPQTGDGSGAPPTAFKQLETLLYDTQGLTDPLVREQLQALVNAGAHEVETGGDESDSGRVDRELESLADDVEAQVPDALSSAATAEATADDDEDDDNEDNEEGMREPPELSDTFLALEKRVETEGFTPEVVAQLQALASGDEGDAYAKETLAYRELFEPAAAAPPNVAEAVANLRRAAAVGVVSARSTLALLELIDSSSSNRGSRVRAQLEQLATQHEDLAASLAAGYAHLRAMDEAQALSSDRADSLACRDAVGHYHRVAESNVHWLADRGGEQPELPGVARLSEQWRPVSSFALDDHDARLADPAQRFEYLRAVAGDPTDPQFADAAELVGQAYFYGDAAAGVAQDQARAAAYFQRAADAGDAHAQANYAMLLAHGAGVPQNNASALRYLRAAAAQGDAFAYFGLGTLFQAGAGPDAPQNDTAALLHFEQAAALGYAEAHTYIGAAYLHGHGVVADGAKAYAHFALAAAESPSSQALFNLAVVQFRGVGTAPTCALAVHNFRAVALHPEALADLPFSLAKGLKCYEQGDVVRAFLHYRLTAELGDEDAMVNAAYLLETHGDAVVFTGGGGDDDDNIATVTIEDENAPLAEAFKLYTRAARLNDTEAIRRTAACSYDAWRGVCERDRSAALARYSLAAELGDAEAAFHCGLMLALGDGVPRDVVAAKVSSARAARGSRFKRYYEQCSEDEFPANVPCAIALVVVDAALALRPLGRFLLQLVGLS